MVDRANPYVMRFQFSLGKRYTVDLTNLNIVKRNPQPTMEFNINIMFTYLTMSQDALRSTSGLTRLSAVPYSRLQDILVRIILHIYPTSTVNDGVMSHTSGAWELQMPAQK